MSIDALSFQAEFDAMTSILLEFDSGRMKSLAKKWGCVPRTILDLIDKDQEDWQIERDYERDAKMAVRKSKEIMFVILNNNYFDGAPPSIFFCRPFTSEAGIVDRMAPCVTIPTRNILRFLGEALRIQSHEIRVNFLDALRQSSDTCQAAGIIFENWFFCFFTAGQTIQCELVEGGDTFQLTGTTTIIPANWGRVEVAEPPYFWIAYRGFPGIDSVLVLKDSIYASQVTISPRHKPPTKGMITFRDHLPGDLKQLPWRVVFVGDDEGSVYQVATSVGEIRLPGSNNSVPIAWSVVDPVRSRITYKVCKFG